MPTGYQDTLFILAFDHRGSFVKKFGIEGDPTAEDTQRISDGKALIYEGLQAAVSDGADAGVAGGLVDEQFGSPTGIPEKIKSAGMKLAMPTEKSGQKEYDFEYGDGFGEHIERYGPDFSKVLVRYNPDGDTEMNQRQAERLARLSQWLSDHDPRFLFELLVPAEQEQLDSVGGDTGRYDSELRPELMVRAIEELQGAGVDPDVWKIEGIDSTEDCKRVVAQCRADGRDAVSCVVLGRGADSEQVNSWLRAAAGVDGYAGFAIGRSIWGDPLSGFLAGDTGREAAASQIGENYRNFISVYKDAAGA